MFFPEIPRKSLVVLWLFRPKWQRFATAWRPTTALRSSRPTITSTWPSRWPSCRSLSHRPWPWSCATIRRRDDWETKNLGKAAGKGAYPSLIHHLGVLHWGWHVDINPFKESWWKSLAINLPLVFRFLGGVSARLDRSDGCDPWRVCVPVHEGIIPTASSNRKVRSCGFADDVVIFPMGNPLLNLQGIPWFFGFFFKQIQVFSVWSRDFLTVLLGRKDKVKICLAGGFKHFLFSIIYGIILPNHQPVSENDWKFGSNGITPVSMNLRGSVPTRMWVSRGKISTVGLSSHMCSISHA